MNRKPSTEYTREERIAGMKAAIAFLEANPDFDIPEGMDHLLVRTLPRQNRGGLATKQEVADWFRRHVEMLQPDWTQSDTDFDAVREFGGGVLIDVHVTADEVCEKTVESKTVNVPTKVEEATWYPPPILIELGFTPDQEKLRERDNSFGKFMRNAA